MKTQLTPHRSHANHAPVSPPPAQDSTHTRFFMLHIIPSRQFDFPQHIFIQSHLHFIVSSRILFFCDHLISFLFILCLRCITFDLHHPRSLYDSLLTRSSLGCYFLFMLFLLLYFSLFFSLPLFFQEFHIGKSTASLWTQSLLYVLTFCFPLYPSLPSYNK